MLNRMLDDAERLLIEVELKPKQGSRFQPTGFPDLGAAEFQVQGETNTILVESAQSMANRLEAVCMKNDADVVDELEGIPMIKVVDADGNPLTNSVTEAHRINSHYIMEGGSDEVKERFKGALEKGDRWDTGIQSVARVLFEIDVCSLLHGFWISKKDVAGGRVRLRRAISSFIEAKNASSAISGGVKLDHVNPGKDEDAGGAKEGQGNIPYPRVEYTAGSITAYFNVDLQQIRSYGLEKKETDFLVNLALWKIRRFLESGLRLRTACDLMASEELRVVSPAGFELPSMKDLDRDVEKSVAACKQSWKPLGEIKYTKKKGA